MMTDFSAPPAPTRLTLEYPDGNSEETLFGEISVGASRCGLKFNPDENPDVRRIKSVAAALMEQFNTHLQDRLPDDSDGKRCFATAMTHLESAQMFAVKGLFTRRNAGKE